MKRSFILPLLLALALITGYLLSRASLVGKVGMTYVYQEYAFLKTWWKGAAVVLAVWLLLLLLQSAAQRKLPLPKARLVQMICIVLALAGLWFTYQDFRHTLSHRLLGERFHLGGYLFWLGWLLISGFLLAGSAKVPARDIPMQTR